MPLMMMQQMGRGGDLNRYTTTASDYDGTDYQTRGATLTGIADGKAGTYVGWIKPAADGTAMTLLAGVTTVGGGTFRFDVDKSSTNTVQVRARNAAGTIILNVNSPNNSVLAGVWTHVAVSWNLAVAGSLRIKINGQAVTQTETTYTDDTIDYTVLDWSHGALAGGTQKVNACLSGVGFHTTYLDFNTASVLARFISNGRPVNPGSDGSAAFGVQPLVYSATGNLTTNAGSGGNFTTVGTLTACATSPSD